MHFKFLAINKRQLELQNHTQNNYCLPYRQRHKAKTCVNAPRRFGCIEIDNLLIETLPKEKNLLRRFILTAIIVNSQSRIIFFQNHQRLKRQRSEKRTYTLLRNVCFCLV